VHTSIKFNKMVFWLHVGTSILVGRVEFVKEPE
jgi:hypothetical protein